MNHLHGIFVKKRDLLQKKHHEHHFFYSWESKGTPSLHKGWWWLIPLASGVGPFNSNDFRTFQCFISKFTRTSCTTTSTLADTDATVWVSQANGRWGEGVSLVYPPDGWGLCCRDLDGSMGVERKCHVLSEIFWRSEACDTFSGFFTYCFL